MPQIEGYGYLGELPQGLLPIFLPQGAVALSYQGPAYGYMGRASNGLRVPHSVAVLSVSKPPISTKSWLPLLKPTFAPKQDTADMDQAIRYFGARDIVIVHSNIEGRDLLSIPSVNSPRVMSSDGGACTVGGYVFEEFTDLQQHIHYALMAHNQLKYMICVEGMFHSRTPSQTVAALQTACTLAVSRSIADAVKETS